MIESSEFGKDGDKSIGVLQFLMKSREEVNELNFLSSYCNDGMNLIDLNCRKYSEFISTAYNLLIRNEEFN